MPARQAEASAKACRAVELVRQGKTYDQVARAVGYANRGTAHRVVTKALSERLIDGIDELRDIEVARLDALQAAIWSRALTGDIRAINTVGRIIDRRCRILGLYPPKGKPEKPFDTLVLPPTGNPRKATDAQSADALPAVAEEFDGERGSAAA